MNHDWLKNFKGDAFIQKVVDSQQMNIDDLLDKWAISSLTVDPLKQRNDGPGRVRSREEHESNVYSFVLLRTFRNPV